MMIQNDPKRVNTNHFNDINSGFDPKETQKLFEVLLDLDAVILWLGHCEDTHRGLSPDFVLPQEEAKKHQDSTIMHNPPDIYRGYISNKYRIKAASTQQRSLYFIRRNLILQLLTSQLLNFCNSV